MAQVKKGSKVRIVYTGKLKDGSVFESNVGKPPLELVAGKGKALKGFEQALLGMSLGQTKTVTLKPADAYGARDPALVWTVAAAELPAGCARETGTEVAFRRADGTEVEGRIVRIEADQVTVDGNHPLAGRNLTFEIKVVGLG
ncbi:MAG: peptidylprolyl isomerase [Thermodesulfobacteriota bacterium]